MHLWHVGVVLMVDWLAGGKEPREGKPNEFLSVGPNLEFGMTYLPV